MPVAPSRDYPDILGMITGGPCLNIDLVQCACSIYPTKTALGQPFEALILLQNACDKAIQTNITLQLPRKDNTGKKINLVTAKENVQVALQPGDVGLLHMPLIPQPPTQPSDNNPIAVKIEVRSQRGANRIRAVHGGRPALDLKMSPYRLKILREIGFFSIAKEPGILRSAFSVIPGQITMTEKPVAAPRYELLWSAKELAQDQSKYFAVFPEAERFANTLTRTKIFESLIAVTAHRYEQAGFPLYEGETLFISKMLCYAMEEGFELEQGFKLTDAHWFHRLISVVGDKALLNDEDALIDYLYTSLIHDAVRLGLTIVERTSRQSMGSAEEHLTYADEVVHSLEGQHPIDLSHAYLPLIMAGIILNAQLKLYKEDLWISLSQIHEATQERMASASSQYGPIFDLVNSFMADAEQFLIKTRVPRPHNV